MSTAERILHCALEELTKRGLEGLSLRSVGTKAGITPMAVYRHYADKADLLRALGEHAFAVWRRRVEAIPGTDVRLWLEDAARAFVDFAMDDPALFDAAFVLRTEVERVYPEDFRAGKSPVVSLMVAQLTRGQAEGLVRAGDALEMAMAVWGVLQGLIQLHRSGRFDMARQDFTELCLRSAQRIYATGA
jgi:AcrR family transcriptional regulator